MFRIPHAQVSMCAIVLIISFAKYRILVDVICKTSFRSQALMWYSHGLENVHEYEYIHDWFVWRR